MKLITTLIMLSLLTLVGTVSTVSAQNITDSYSDTRDNGCPKHGFGSDADFCAPGFGHKKHNNNNDKGVYACNVITDTDKFCKENLKKNEQKQQDNNRHTAGIGKITVEYGGVYSYYGKGKVVIKNLDNGKTLVTHDLNFAKQHHNQGPDCCVKTYTFNKSGTFNGDRISVKVTAIGGGSWTDSPHNYKNNLRISVYLDEIGE